MTDAKVFCVIDRWAMCLFAERTRFLNEKINSKTASFHSPARIKNDLVVLLVGGDCVSMCVCVCVSVSVKLLLKKGCSRQAPYFLGGKQPTAPGFFVTSFVLICGLSLGIWGVVVYRLILMVVLSRWYWGCVVVVCDIPMDGHLVNIWVRSDKWSVSLW